jgi:hypothetical protein
VRWPARHRKVDGEKDLAFLADVDDLGSEIAERACHLQTDDTRPDDDQTSPKTRRNRISSELIAALMPGRTGTTGMDPAAMSSDLMLPT